MHQTHVAVIGAGIAGLSCAAELRRGDAQVTVFEKSRGLGGRLATRRVGPFAFDHGAQFFTVRNAGMSRFLASAQVSGTVAAWQPRTCVDGNIEAQPQQDWHVGAPGMSALVRNLTRGIEIKTGVSVHELLKGQRGWELQTDAGLQSTLFDAIVVAVPAPQALTLLSQHGRGFRRLLEVGMAPCWTAMAAFETPLPLQSDVFRWSGGVVRWAACDSAKPGRPKGPQAWVLQASADWSAKNLNAGTGEAAGMLLAEFGAATGITLPKPVHLEGHRWRHALVERPLGRPCLTDEDIAAVACGDWCTAPRVEAAFDSGRAAARAALAMIGLSGPLTKR
jgi:hypothetical protein